MPRSKIETIGGDPYRALKTGGDRNLGNVHISMEQNNRNKKSVALDLKTEEGREALLRLIETADVFLTSLRPKAIRALRLDVEDLRARNPNIIYVRGNGVGFRGAEADRPGYVAGPTSFDGSLFAGEPACSPRRGADTESLLAEAGYSGEAIADMQARAIAR